MRLLKRLKHIGEYAIVRVILFLLNVVPVKVALLFGAFVGEVAYRLRIRYKVSFANIKLMLGEHAAKAEIETIMRESYRNFGRSMVEYALLPRLKSKLKEIVAIENKEVLDSARDSGAILVTGHYGSWELLGAALREYGYPVDFLVGEQKNILVDNLMNKLRHRMGIGTIKLGVSSKGVLKALKERKYVAMLSDQDAGNSGVIVSFLGFQASTPKGAAAFALAANVPILTGAIIRNPDKRTHRVRIYRIDPAESLPKDEAIKMLTEAYTRVLESIIREEPSGWFWAHRRFKSTIRGLYK